MFLLYFFLFVTSALADSPEQLGRLLLESEKVIEGVKPNSYGYAVLANKKERTDLALLYLHGFSGSPAEMRPLIEELSKNLNANAYLPRLSGHGFNGADGFRDITLRDWQNDILHSVEFAKKFGKKLVVIATSTSAPLILDYSANHPHDLAGVIMISPNFGLPRWDSKLLLLPGGKWIARLVIGEYREWKPRSEGEAAYWTTKYPSAILVEMMKATSLAFYTEEMRKVKVPIYTLHCDNDTLVNIKLIPPVVNSLSSQVKPVESMHCEEDTHILAGDILSPKSTKIVEPKLESFIKKLR